MTAEVAPGQGADATPGAVPAGQHPRRRGPGPGKALVRPGVGLAAVLAFELLFASVFLGVLHRPVPHHAPVAVSGASPLASLVARHGGGIIRLTGAPDAAAARAAMLDGRVNAAVEASPRGETLLIQTAAGPGVAAVLTKAFTSAAAALKVPLAVRDLAPLPASDPTGISAFFLIIAWMLGGYVGATVLAVTLGGPRSPTLRHALLRLGLLAAYAVVSGLLGALLIGPALGVVSGYNTALAGLGILLTVAAAAATAGLQAVLGLPGTVLAILAMVVVGDPTAGQSVPAALLASPWNVIGQGLPPGAGFADARSILYLGGANLTGPLTVLAVWAAVGTLLVLGAAAWRQRRPAGSVAA